MTATSVTAIGTNQLVKAIHDTPAQWRPLIHRAIQEMFNPCMFEFEHGKRHGRNLGCKGPMCQKALRDWQRERTAERARRRGDTVRAYRRPLEAIEADLELERVTAAYRTYWDNRLKESFDPVQTALHLAEMTHGW